ncbi:MAG: flavin reductase family protein [Nocardioides sp.]|nr:flavin reductase family protein [Nocardioides sp.]
MSSEAEVPRVVEATAPCTHTTWPSHDVIESWLGDPDEDDGPGADTHVRTHDGAEARAASTRHLRDVLGRFASGVTVVTALSEGEPIGLTCQSFASVSLDPPLVLFVAARTSRAWPLIRASGTFCVNILADGQEDLSNTMASRGTDKYAGVDWTPSPRTGSPVLPGTVGFVDCTVHAVHAAGDHDVVIGRVVDLDACDGGRPLLFNRGAYTTVAD